MRPILLRGASLLSLMLTCLYLALPSDATASTAMIIYTFAGGTDGAYPYSDLIADSAGNLYGTTYGGGMGCSGACGTVFKLLRTKDGWKHQVLYNFAVSPSPFDGVRPKSGLVFDNAGNLYGATPEGGNSYLGDGTVFKLTPNSHGGWTESVIHNFDSTKGDGASPDTDLVFDSHGNLYGTTGAGGSGSCQGYGCGTVFKLTPNPNGTWTESTIYVFAGAPNDASRPSSAVVLDADGNIYGATEYGGGRVPYRCQGGTGLFGGCGAIYKLTPGSGGDWTETLLYTFHLFQGTAVNPDGGFLFDADGRILGTSSNGGDRYGAFFQLEQTKKGWEQTVQYRFYGNPDGKNPIGRLAMGPDGNLFGATSLGGTNGCGTVFRLDHGKHGWKERVLINLDSTACAPLAGPMVDSHGHVYGTTSRGGSANFGAVYEIIP